MKKILITLCFVFLHSVVAKEGSMCNYYYDSITRKVNIIEKKKDDLSKMALKKLYGDLTFEVGQCFSNCEGDKFNYCNEIAKEIEK
ncbi:hypothetical protein [Poseidonibacter ostreae]|uniref:Uncharacterized protein n=1 Tax=Poseidonibacter ostreae TaxID=2654171 RepID=A0ABQ6VH85_9BACT|nr:hypothetical protein [Poseidonibacter ostreae]KAB7886087.1 hypothetical protein GBG18_14805 [Poseidonibacter ostreae]